MTAGSGNLFSVRPPENLAAAEAFGLFVDVFTDFPKVAEAEMHTMVHGPRGSGKSMMFRVLQPDCQLLKRECDIAHLPFLGFQVPIKNTNINITDLRRIEGRPSDLLLSEHRLSLFVIGTVLNAIRSKVVPEIEETSNDLDATIELGNWVLRRLALLGRVPNKQFRDSYESLEEIYADLHELFDDLYHQVGALAKRLSFRPREPLRYEGPLLGYTDMVLPLFRCLKELEYLPDGPIFLMIDDADYLSTGQTRALNSWVSTRTQDEVSIKISTQFRYKTFQTGQDLRIEAPHDFSEVFLTDIYTTRRSGAPRYQKRATAIINRRLEVGGIEATPEEFFPPDETQEKEIQDIEKEIRANWKEEGRGYRPSDDVLRYARPTYIARLKGTRKSGSTYSYAGFQQLVDISSGVVRSLLESAAQMYGIEQSIADDAEVNQITPTVQNQVVRDLAEHLLSEGFDQLFSEEMVAAEDDDRRKFLQDRKVKLSNLIQVLGNLFHQKLISDDAERRVFSVAFSRDPDLELRDLFALGIHFGYFQRSSIGNKDGTGRTTLYVLTRRLAPYFTLDPTGFAGYLWMTPDRLWEGIENPQKFLRRAKTEGVEKVAETHQLMLPIELEEKP